MLSKNVTGHQMENVTSMPGFDKPNGRQVSPPENRMQDNTYFSCTRDHPP